MNTQNTQSSILNSKVIFVGISLTVTALFATWFVSDDSQSVNENVVSEGVSLSQENNVDGAVNKVSNLNVEFTGDEKQNQIFDDIWEKIHDPDMRNSLTARQLIDMSGFKELSAEQMQRLVTEVMALLDRNELDRDLFMTNLSDKNGIVSSLLNKSVSEDILDSSQANTVKTPATPEQAQAMEEVRQLLSNPETASTITAAELLESANVKSLPAHLRHELADEVVAMLSSGEIDRDIFLATKPSVQPDVQVDEEAMRASTTHEQWQSFGNLQSRLHDPEFKAEVMISEILTSQEYKILPEYLRAKLSAEAVAMLETNSAQ